MRPRTRQNMCAQNDIKLRLIEEVEEPETTKIHTKPVNAGRATPESTKIHRQNEHASAKARKSQRVPSGTSVWHPGPGAPHRVPSVIKPFTTQKKVYFFLRTGSVSNLQASGTYTTLFCFKSPSKWHIHNSKNRSHSHLQLLGSSH